MLFGLTFEVEGLELAGPGPVLVLIRHASIIDNTLPDALIGHEHGLGLRFVLKRELESIPTIDIGGRWVPTNFVRRASGDPAREIANLRTARARHGRRTRRSSSTPRARGTRRRSCARRRRRSPSASREIAPLANRLHNLLPPRLGGPLALLDEGKGMDVVVCGHVGLDGFEYIRDIWAGGLVGTTVRVKLWRFAAAEVPAAEDERVRWLYERWQTLDDWVGEQLSAGS